MITDTQTVSVTAPIWGFHNALWGEPIPLEPLVWDVHFDVTHPAETVFGAVRVGVTPKTTFSSRSGNMLAGSASISLQDGVCHVSTVALHQSTAISTTNAAKITIRIDCQNKTIRWAIDGVFGEAVPLGDLGREQLHPFVSLSYLGDEAVWGGASVEPEELLEGGGEGEEGGCAGVFRWADRNDDGLLDAAEIAFLADRTGVAALALLPTPIELHHLEELVQKDDTVLETLTEALLERRVDPNDVDGDGDGAGAVPKPRSLFPDQATWDEAPPEVLPVVEPATRAHPETGEMCTRRDFLAMGLSDDDWREAAGGGEVAVEEG